ncbi:hypothetical protein KVV02_003479 [Mortierella alpina]|uniref:Rab-GAP TBC domain-containing protein n=1 Tax=Mortierella alpina TaxID=64518 RepID=A0A9P8A0V2_MORAP|nr:hypothetical protein KVV02_003479 [Mortierella alpina]
MHSINTYTMSTDGKVLRGIAQGEAIRNVHGQTAQDLMFFAGEQVVLLERLESGLCMGLCEGVVGRFREQDVDFGTWPSKNSPQIAIPAPTASATATATASPSSPLPPSLSSFPSPTTSLSTAAEEPSSTIAALQRPPSSYSASTPPSPPPAPTLRPVLMDMNGACTSRSVADEQAIFGPGTRKWSEATASQEDLVVFSALAEQATLISSSLVLDPLKAGDQAAPELKERHKPRKLLSAENLRLGSTATTASPSSAPRRLILSSPPTPSSSEHFSLPSPIAHPGTDTMPATTTSPITNTISVNYTSTAPPAVDHGLSYSKGADKRNLSHGLLSPPTQSTASSNADLTNGSSASITTNLLGIKSQVFNQLDHQQPRRAPSPVNAIYQLSTPSSSNNSLTSSKPMSPVNSLTSVSLSVTQTISSTRKGSTGVQNGAGSQKPNSRPTTPTKEERPLQQKQQQERATQTKKKSSKKPPTRLRTSSKDPASSSSSSLASPSLMDMQHDIGRDYALSGRQPLHNRHEPQQQDHYFATVFGDLRSKTHNALRKAGFSIAPDAGLFSDRESTKPMDLKVVRMLPTSSANAAAAAAATASTTAVAATSGQQQQRSGSQSAGDKEKERSKSTGFFGRPRSRSVKENRPPALDARPPPLPPMTTSSTEHGSVVGSLSSSSSSATAVATSQLPPLSTSSSSSSSSVFSVRFDRLRQWSISDRGHHRSNSGPARHTDVGAPQKLTGLEESRVMDQYVHGSGDSHMQALPLPPLPPLPPQVVIDGGGSGPGGGGPGNTSNSSGGGILAELRRKKKGHQRRMSEATTLTVASTRSAGGYSQRIQIQQQQQQQHQASGLGSPVPLPQPEKQGRAMGNWFGKSKRRSYHSIEEVDPRKPHVFGNGIEGGVDSRPTSMLFFDCDEDDEDLFDDSEAEEEERETGRHSRRATGDGTAWSTVAEVGEKKPQVVVNHYGFICDKQEETVKPQEQNGSGSGSIVGEMAAKLDSAFLAEHERKRLMKKQHEFTRVSEIKWMHAVTQLQPEQVKKSNKYKKLARRGVPTSVRGRVWQFLANTHQYREPGLFQELLTRGHIPIHDVIARDVHRCYPDHVHFRDGMGGTGQEDLHSILKAYAHYKPSVGYCQGMGRLVGMMLMQMPVEEAFWLLVATIESYLNEYFTPTLRQLRIDAQVFERLLKAEDPRLAAHLERNDVLPIMYMTQWFLTLFTMSLPWASVLRVWDVFYFDGVKTLFRVGLAVLQICRSHLLEHCPSSSECMDYLLHVPLDILGPEVLLERTAFRIRLKRDNIEKISALTAGEMDAKEGGTETSKASDTSAVSKGPVSPPLSAQKVESIPSSPVARSPISSPKSLPATPSDSETVHTTAGSAIAAALSIVTTPEAIVTARGNVEVTQQDKAESPEVKVDGIGDGDRRAQQSPSGPASPTSPTGSGSPASPSSPTSPSSPISFSQDKALPALPSKPRSQPAVSRSLTLSTSSPSLAEVASLACVTVPAPLSPLPPLPPSVAAPVGAGGTSGFLFKMRKRAGTMRG